ncbi:hypothetical protein ACH4D5_19505 [Streptomyces sp. NPDC018029]|uniref:hypothetical protein n=1 Tax=Streptomyces sp. NPDC018029 TaxID=3365032 RepID=UPI0037914C60
MSQSCPRRPRTGRGMTTRTARPRGHAVRVALIALIFVFLAPLFGIDGASASASVGPETARRATAVSVAPRADSQAEDRGCHEGQPADPRGGVVPCPDPPGSHTPKSTSTPPSPPHVVPVLAGTSHQDVTSVDLYGIQIIRT